MSRFLVICFFLFSNSCFALSPSIPLTEQTQTLQVNTFQIFADKTGSMTQEQVSNAVFEEYHGTLLESKPQGSLWLRFDLQREENASNEWLFEFNMPLVKQVDLYELQTDGTFLARHFNYLNDWDKREVDYRNVVFKLSLPANQSKRFYLKILSDIPISASVQIWHPKKFQENIKTDTRNYGIIVGFWLASWLLLFFFLIIRKNSSVALYFALSATYIFTLLILFGYLQWLLFPALAKYQILLSGIGILVTGVFSAYLSFYFLQLPRRLPRFNRGFLTVAPIIYLCVFVALIIPKYHLVGRQAAQLVILIHSVMLTYLGFWVSWRYKSPSALVFTLGMLPSRLNSILYILRKMSVVAPSFYTVDSFFVMVTTISNITLVELGLFAFYVELNKKNQRVNQQLRDIEHRIGYEKKANQERFNFLRSLSHELRTPATVINMAVQNLRLVFESSNKPPDENLVSTRLERIYTASERLNALLEENMSRYQLAFESSEIEIKTCHTQDLVTLIMDDLKTAELTSVKLQTKQLPVEIRCDLALIRVSVRNLIHNAFKHSQHGDFVQLEFKGMRRGGLRISVKDNGRGISKQELPFIFEQFYRGEMRAKHEGSGLGLYLVKHITTLHRGRIRAYSTEGIGTQIVIFLPSGKRDV